MWKLCAWYTAGLTLQKLYKEYYTKTFPSYPGEEVKLKMYKVIQLGLVCDLKHREEKGTCETPTFDRS